QQLFNAATVDGLSAFQAETWRCHNSKAAAWARHLHGRMACGESGHHAPQFVGNRSRAMGLAAEKREHDRGHQHNSLLLAAAARSHSSVGQFAIARADAYRTYPHLPLIHSMPVSGARRSTHLDRVIPSDDRKALGFCAAVRALDYLFAGSGVDN